MFYLIFTGIKKFPPLPCSTKNTPNPPYPIRTRGVGDGIHPPLLKKSSTFIKKSFNKLFLKLFLDIIIFLKRFLGPPLTPWDLCEVFFLAYEVLGIKIGLKGCVEFVSEYIFGKY